MSIFFWKILEFLFIDVCVINIRNHYSKLPKLKRIYYDAPPTTPDTSERTVTLYEDCSNISLFLVQYQYLGVYGCIATMLCTKSTTAEIKVGDTTTKASVRFVDANTCAIKNTDKSTLFQIECFQVVNLPY